MEGIIILLLERGADMNAHARQYGCPLHTALALRLENVNLQVSYIVKVELNID